MQFESEVSGSPPCLMLTGSQGHPAEALSSSNEGWFTGPKLSLSCAVSTAQTLTCPSLSHQRKEPGCFVSSGAENLSVPDPKGLRWGRGRRLLRRPSPVLRLPGQSCQGLLETGLIGAGSTSSGGSTGTEKEDCVQADWL